MLIIISPAKKLDVSDKKIKTFSTPQFIQDSEKLIKVLRKYGPKKLKELMGLSPALVDLNRKRYAEWRPEHRIEETKQAILTFNGEVYNGLDVGSFSKKDLDYAQDNMRILSGLYGLLKPLDLIHPYRLEMGTKLKSGRKNNLYAFWGDKLMEEVNTILQDGILVNLASNEYFKAINRKGLKARVITPTFKDFNNGKYKTVMVYAKKARGMMASYIIKNRIKKAEDLVGFDVDGYCYNAKASTENEMVFYRG